LLALAETKPMSRLRGRHAVSALGAALLLVATIHHGAEIGTVEVPIGPLLALLLDGGIAVAVIVAGRRIGRADLSAAAEWRVARWAGAGTAIAAAAFAATVLVRSFEGRPIAEPLFPLLVVAGTGALAGTVAGYYAARQSVAAERAQNAVRAVTFVNHLLRHDLRNDLTTIRGYAELALEARSDDAPAPDDPGDSASVDADDPASGDESGPVPVAVIATTADTGLDRIETTGAVADALLGDSDHHRIDLAETARTVAAGFADRSDVTVETDLADAAPIRANEGVRSVVDNLVENAAEHAGEHPTVRVTVSADDEAVTLAVDDDGPGIPSDCRDPAERDAEGFGGLRLVETLVEDYGGRLSVDDSDLGGARVEATFPRA
jgi:signal transduction histidine kinase